MQELKTFDAPNSSDLYRYLVKKKDDVEDIVGQIKITSNLTDKPSRHGFKDLPSGYPYVLVAYADQRYDYIDVTFVELSDFN